MLDDGRTPAAPAPFTAADLRMLDEGLGQLHFVTRFTGIETLRGKVRAHQQYLRAHRPLGDAATHADQLDRHAADLLSMVPSEEASPFTVVAVTLESLRHVARLLRAAAVLLRTPPDEEA